MTCTWCGRHFVTRIKDNGRWDHRWDDEACYCPSCLEYKDEVLSRELNDLREVLDCPPGRTTQTLIDMLREEKENE